MRNISKMNAEINPNIKLNTQIMSKHHEGKTAVDYYSV